VTYRATSTLNRTSDGERLDLATALGVTPTGLVENPVFFTGFVTRPDITAGGLLAVADVANTRYADAGLAKRVANLDPVVTAGGDRLRFESFSLCNSVYARFDLLPDGLGSCEVSFGTTNVDINQPLRTALARIGRAETLHLAVGSEELRAATLDGGTHIERKVALPDRWVRGLAEVPALTSSMRLHGELTGPAIVRLLAALPRTQPPGPTLHIQVRPSGWTVGHRQTPGSFPIPGATRLRGAERLLRHAHRIRTYATANGTTAWLIDVPGGRMTLALSPDPYRGFSGEGTLLLQLTDHQAEVHGRSLLDTLGWSATVDAADLARRTGLTGHQVASGLAWLSASGRLGFDLADNAWFHRELPVDTEKVLRRNPRLKAAHELYENGGVTAAQAGTWHVQGTVQNHKVTTVPGSGPRCTCQWDSEYTGTRGPCKHILAVALSLRS
jgi:hypothetical protein